MLAVMWTAPAAAQTVSTLGELSAQGITLDKQSLADFKVIERSQNYITAPAAARWQALDAMTLSFRVSDSASRSYTVYHSPAGTLLESSLTVVAMSQRGAFRISRKSTADPYRVDLAVTATELAGDVNAWQIFVDRSGLAAVARSRTAARGPA